MATASKPSRRQLEPDSLQGILDAHTAWLRSGGDDGARADLSDTDLADADLSSCNLASAIFTGADLSGADLSHALLDQAQLGRADLSGAELMGASLVGADLTWADLTGADLTDANLSRALLPDADLANAKLVRADFTQAEMDGADLTGADIDGTIMDGADMSGTRFSDNDGELDDAFEAGDVYDEPDVEPVSELPDADSDTDDAPPAPMFSEAPEPAVAAQSAPGPVAEPTPEPAADAPPEPTPGGPTDRARQVAAQVAAHQRWLASDGAEGERADLSAVVPLPLPALAGANLFHAVLPPGNPLGFALDRAEALAVRARRATMVVVAACIYAVVTLLSAMAFPGAPVRLPLLDAAVGAPFVAAGIPATLLVLYLWLHGTIQRLGSVLSGLPKVLPDGTTPSGTCIAATGKTRGALWVCSRVLTQLFAWAAVPATLALYWGAFLPHATQAGITTLALFTAIASGVGMFSWARLRNRLD